MIDATIMRNLTTAVLYLDTTLHVQRLNPAGELLFGVSERHCRAQALATALPGLAVQQERLRRTQHDGVGYVQRELRLHQAGGEPVTVDCTVTPVDAENGTTALLLEFTPRDRQRRIRQDNRMHNRNLANRDMLRGLAHEIKNPLGGLRGAAQLLERELQTSEHKEYTAVIIREADRLRRLVDAMLGPQQPPQRECLNVHEPLEQVRDVLAGDLPPGVAIERDYDPSLPSLHADREQLVQVFFNLVGNAVAALADGGHDGAIGRITLRTRAQWRFTIAGVQHRLVARIDVIDNGPGIAADLLPRIFHPLVSSRADGSGLGLPITQYLLERNGGLLECDSRPGRTVFSVFLPLDDGRGPEHDHEH